MKGINPLRGLVDCINHLGLKWLKSEKQILSGQELKEEKWKLILEQWQE
ncbi:hypothetical protein [Paenibacillus xylanivorans]|nr:hypothetical protein [Paenibacillus xylanivorans]